MIPTNLLLFSLAVYGVGCAVSQSLMSLGGTLLAAYAFWSLFTQTKKAWASFLPSEKFALSFGVFFLFYSLLNHVLSGPSEVFWGSLKNLPLFAVPLFSFFISQSIASSWDSKLKDNVGLVLIAIAAAYVVSALKAMYQSLGIGHPAYGFFGNAIYFAYNILPAFVFFMELGIRKFHFGKWRPRYAFALAGLLLLVIYLSSSRMVLLTAGFYLMLRTIPFMIREYGWVVTLMIVSIIFFSSWELLANNEYLREKWNRSKSLDDPSWKWRLVAWEHNWNLFLANPWFGVGPERNAIDVATMPQYAGHWLPGFRIYAHSVYLQILAELGFVGIAGFLMFFAYFISLESIAAWVAVFFLLSGISENVLNNSKALHPVYFYLFFGAYIRRMVNHK